MKYYLFYGNNKGVYDKSFTTKEELHKWIIDNSAEIGWIIHTIYGELIDSGELIDLREQGAPVIIQNSRGYDREWNPSEYSCLNCGEKSVWWCEEEEEDNAGYAHLCIGCGYGFYHPGSSYTVPNCDEVVKEIKKALGQ